MSGESFVVLTSLLERDSNMVGFGLARKQISGRAPGAMGVTVYVRNKLPFAEVPVGLAVPPTVATLKGPMATDVVAVGMPQLMGLTINDRVRPAPTGVSIGIVGGLPGTLGCLVRDNTDDSIQILSTAGLLSQGGHMPPGTLVYQPAPSSSTPDPNDVIGTLTRTTQLSTYPSLYPPPTSPPVNSVDGALVRPTVPSMVEDSVLGRKFPPGSRMHPMIGLVVGVEIDTDSVARYVIAPIRELMTALNVSPLREGSVVAPEVDQVVEMMGAAEGTRRGVVDAIQATYKVHYASLTGPTIGIIQNVALVRGDFGAEADIGAVVFTWAGNGVRSHCSGCAIATDLERTYGIPLTQNVALADQLRDDYLVKTSTGRMLAQLFYKNETRFQQRLQAVSPTKAELDYARLLYDKYVALARAEISKVTMTYIPLTPQSLDEARAAVYGLSRFMTDAEYDACQDLLDVLAAVENLSLREAMEYMDRAYISENVHSILESVPGWDTTYDAK